MPHQQTSDLLLKQLIDAYADAAFYLEAVRDEQGRLIDLTFAYHNPKALEIMQVVFQALPGERMLAHKGAYTDSLIPIFAQYAAVLETGETQTFSFLSSQLGRIIHVTRTRLGNGILVVVREPGQLEQPNPLALEQTDLLSGILEASLNGIITYQSIRNHVGEITDFMFVRLNSAARRMLHLTEETTGKPMLEELPGVKEAGLFDKFIKVVETGEPVQFETPFIAGEETFWYDMSVVKLGDGFVVTFNDITESKRGELENENQRTLLNGILNASQDAIIVLKAIRDTDGHIVDFQYKHVNPMVERLFGYPADFLYTSTFLTLYPATKELGLFDKYCAVVDTGETFHTESYYEDDTLHNWYDIVAVKLEDGIVLTAKDISARKLAERKVEQQAAENKRQADLLDSVLNNSNSGIMRFQAVRDETGQIVDFLVVTVNEATRQLVNRPPESLLGYRLLTLFPGNRESGLFDLYVRTTETGEPGQTEIHYNYDGLNFWFDISARKLDDGFVVTFADISSQKRLQQQLQASVFDLQRSNENLEQFAYVASHDLQEPLRKIIAFGSILQNQYEDVLGSGGADLINRMQSAASRMQILVRDVLAYSRITTKRETANEVNLNQVLSEVLDNLEATLLEKEAVVKRDQLPVLRGDASQLRQLFQNLLGNALKFTKPDVRPELSVTCREIRGRDSGINIPASEENKHFYLIEVIDNGIGFETKHAERIFQVFQRLHGRSTYEGTGIGLAIVKKVIDNHSGYITAEGCPGEGATFKILLPVR